MTLPLGEDSNVGFKDYDDLIFNGNKLNDSLSPFTSDLWNKTMKWYGIFSTISGSLILIAVFILGYKIIVAGMNTARKNEAKESLMNLYNNMTKKPKFMCVIVGFTDVIAKDPETGIYIVPITALKP